MFKTVTFLDAEPFRGIIMTIIIGQTLAGRETWVYDQRGRCHKFRT